MAKVQQALDENDLLIGTVDTWLLWNLTGGVYITDATNASRTQLMDLETLEWDPFLFSFFELPFKPCHLAKIVSSSEVYGRLNFSKIQGTPISGCLGKLFYSKYEKLLGRKLQIPIHNFTILAV